MARPDPARKGTTETAREATSAENSKDSFKVLIVSMVLAIVAAVILFWYFGIFPFHHAPTAPTG
jgi:flagellar basal body-associated protein FliL